MGITFFVYNLVEDVPFLILYKLIMGSGKITIVRASYYLGRLRSGSHVAAVAERVPQAGFTYTFGANSKWE